MSDFFIVVSLYAKAGLEDQLREQLVAVVEPSRSDEGNLRYELFADRDDPRRFVFVEHWASPQAQQCHHTATAHIRRFNETGASAVEKIEFLYKLDSLV
ncbi:putative quinol monooxygenase [Variovorax ureilyticus]|uniref:Quinol monooxygenase n=1 Tax=Variovorax ureilyticus TaxID=1836198 RepID=A0ABU8VJV0_9BURK